MCVGRCWRGSGSVHENTPRCHRHARALCFIDFSCSAGASFVYMGSGRRMVLLLISRIFSPIDIVWSFLSGFVTSGTIRWNASDEFRAIWVFFAWSFCCAVALSSSRVLISLPAEALANAIRRIPNESILKIRSRRGICDCRTLIPRQQWKNLCRRLSKAYGAFALDGQRNVA